MVFQEFPPKQGKGKVSGSIIPMTLKRLYVEMITGPCMKIAMLVRYECERSKYLLFCIVEKTFSYNLLYIYFKSARFFFLQFLY